MINFSTPQFKIQNSQFKITEASAKESRRAGTAEYVTKDERRINIPPNSKFTIQNSKSLQLLKRQF